MSDLSLIKGIGKVTADKLNKIDIYNSDDLITYYPYRYEILKKTNINDEHAVITGAVSSVPFVSYFNRKNKLSFKLNTDNKVINRGK